ILFGYYSGPLFTQDEMQCLEHPALCSFRDKLYTMQDGSQASGKSIATPTLNHFARAEENAVKSATTVFDERLGSRAPKYGEGNYTNSTIRMIIEIAYSGVLAVRFESLVETRVFERRHKNEEHTVIPKKEDFAAAHLAETYRELTMDVDEMVKVDDFITKLERKNFQWGFSN
ncbi:25600_t:CDS:2, partial [Racocetra persica]